jgi:CRISPR-associated endonuclease/helicase Cas3
MLCIVNSRAHARSLFDAIGSLDGAAHLSTLMCPAHRRLVLGNLKNDLANGRPARVVATSLIEAGVDIDFPEVWRASAGIDSIAQAAGRCNRERTRPEGRVVVFEPKDWKPPHALQKLASAADHVFRAGLDPLSIQGVTAFFQEVYWREGAAAFDAANIDKQIYPILAHLDAAAADLAFDFETIARAFRMIDEAQQTVFVPFNADAEALLAHISAAERPAKAELRRLQLYGVSIPLRVRDHWLHTGVLIPVHRALGEAMLRTTDMSLYRSQTGLNLADPDWRATETNIF